MPCDDDDDDDDGDELAAGLRYCLGRFLSESCYKVS
jgi:hypothetical protein